VLAAPEAHTLRSIELGTAEKTLAAGLGGAVVGTLALAAGWHTIGWALLNFFPGVAVVAVVASVVTAVFTQDSALSKRKEQIRKAVTEYHHRLLLFLDTQKIDELGQRTLRAKMIAEDAEIVTRTMAGWEAAVSGRLRATHYRALDEATTKHLLLVQTCLSQLG
jgi:hypothetical protein